MPTAARIVKFLRSSNRLAKFLDTQSKDDQLTMLVDTLTSRAVKHGISMTTVFNELLDAFQMEYAFAKCNKDWAKVQATMEARAKNNHQKIKQAMKPLNRKGNVMPFKGSES